MNDRNQRPIGPLWPLLGFAAAALFAFVVLPFAALAPFKELMTNSAYRTWQILVLLQALLWIFGSAYAIDCWRRQSTGRTILLNSSVAIILLWFLTGLPYLLALCFPTAGDIDLRESAVLPRYFIASGSGILASVIVGAGIIRIHVQARDYLHGRPEDLASYRVLSSGLETHLLLLGGILAGAVMGTNVSREAIFSMEGRYPFPEVHIWQLAIYWSLLLAVVYLAARVSLRHRGQNIRDAILSTDDSDQHDAARLKRRKEVSEALGLNQNYVADLQSVISILTPIAGAVVSKLVTSG